MSSDLTQPPQKKLVTITGETAKKILEESVSYDIKGQLILQHFTGYTTEIYEARGHGESLELRPATPEQQGAVREKILGARTPFNRKYHTFRDERPSHSSD